MENFLRITSKSFFYNLIAHDYHVYNGDSYNSFVVTKLICSKCQLVWKTSLQECFFCGTESYHVYTCTNCNKRISITRASTNVCDGCGEKNTFKQLCINNECISNTNQALRRKVHSGKGIFDGNGGFSIRKMSCKQCGSRHNEYITAECTIVKSKEELDTPFSIYVERESPEDPAKFYWVKKEGELQFFQNIESLMDYQLVRKI